MQGRRPVSRAAPITLIDGNKVIELLLKHGVGVKEAANPDRDR
jgi:restriction endonuclease Mrr